MWEDEWKGLSLRLDRWHATAQVFVQHLEQMPREDWQRAAANALGHEALAIFKGIDALELPADLRRKLEEIKGRLGPLMRIMDDKAGRYLVSYRWVVLAALRAPLDQAIATSEEPRRRLVERAFLHLNRTLTVDPDTRRRWSDAFAQRRAEEECEKLGALHLLSHGIYSFKANAVSGRTDLILGTPLAINNDVRSTEALVLTEWKLVRAGDDPAAKALEGRAQAERYASVELGGIELRRHRYVVLVSMQAIPMPLDEQPQGVTTHYVNVVIDPLSPSEHSRWVVRNS